MTLIRQWPRPGVLPAVVAAARSRLEQIVVPVANAAEAAPVPSVTVRAARPPVEGGRGGPSTAAAIWDHGWGR